MTYEYACAACGHQWEAEQSIRDAPLRKCPKCQKLQAKRQISRGAGFILKGGGWYADGYGSAGSGGKTKADSSETKTSEATSTSTSEATSTSDGAKGTDPKPSGSDDSKGKTAAA